MKNCQTFSTDTATLVLYDEQSLKAHFDEDCDWWTGRGDLDQEEIAERLLYIDTGSDGTFSLSVELGGDHSKGKTLVKQSRLTAPTGRLYYGPGEYLPGEGVTFFDELPMIQVLPGKYDVTVYERESPGVIRAYIVELTPSNEEFSEEGGDG